MTPQEIFEYKQRWMPGYAVRIHSDLRNRAIDYCKINLRQHQWKHREYTDVYEHTFYFENELDAKTFETNFEERFINQ